MSEVNGIQVRQGGEYTDRAQRREIAAEATRRANDTA